MLNARQIALVQSSFAQVEPIADAAAAMFYERLFVLDPSLTRLFKDDTTVRRDFIRGMGEVASRFVILLEPDKAFDVNEMAQLCESAHGALA